MAKNNNQNTDNDKISIREQLKRQDGKAPSIVGDIRKTRNGKAMLRIAATIPIATLEQTISMAKKKGTADNRGVPMAWVSFNLFENQIEDLAQVVLPALEEFMSE